MDKKDISRGDLANRLSMSYSQLSSYIGKNPSKGIGDEVAARLEDAFELNRGDLDVNHELIEKFSIGNTPKWNKNIPLNMELITVPLYSQERISCVSDYLNSDYEKNLEVAILEKRKVLKLGINPQDVRAFKNNGDSMLPIIPHEAEIFFDSSKTSIIRDGAIYLVCLGGLFLLKRVFKTPNNGFLLVSENPNKTLFKDIEINNNSLEFSVLGTVFHVDFSIPF